VTTRAMLAALMRALLSCVLAFAAACGDDGDTRPQASWSLLGSQRTSSLLSVWAPSTDNVWIVGGREGLGGKPVIWHLDATGWTNLVATETALDLSNTGSWSVFGFDDGTVFMGGSNGTLLRYKDGTLTKLATPAADIVFGIGGASSNDVWAVGGQANARGFVWRYDGSDVTAVSGLPTELETGTVWKVVARAANDVFMSATQGIVLHWDGQALASTAVGGAEDSLFAISCNDARCVAAGTNTAAGVIYEYAGTDWVSTVPSQGGPVWRGITPTGEHTYVVGASG